MKRIIMLLPILAIMFSSCATYPGGQTTQNRKIAKYSLAYATKMPDVDQIGNVSYIFNKSIGGFIVFKGDTTRVAELRALFADTANSEPGVAKYTVLDIAPFTLFTEEELQKAEKTDPTARRRVLELGKWRMYSIKEAEYLNYNDLTAEEKAFLATLENPTVTNSPAKKVLTSASPADLKKTNIPAKTTIPGRRKFGDKKP